MNILFDHQTFSLQKYGGISRYYRELIDGINLSPGHHAKLSVIWSDNINANKPVPFGNVSFKKRSAMLYKLNQTYSQYCVRNNKYNVFHATYYDDYFLDNIGDKPFVITLYDLTHERLTHRFPELVIDKYSVGKRILANRAAAVIAISEHTRQDAIELLGVEPSRIHVTHLATSLTPPPYNKKQLDKSFLLFVGNRGHYKNFNGLLKALALLKHSIEIPLVCAGGGRFTKQEYNIISELGLSDRVSQKSFKTDIELSHLYSSALAFIFPSYYEGFGLPVLEAFSCECPCLLSSTSSLPEIAGNAALYFDPENPESIANAITKIAFSNELRQNIIKHGKNRLNHFSWDKTVNNTLNIYRSVT